MIRSVEDIIRARSCLCWYPSANADFRRIACLRSYENSLYASPDDFDDINLYRVL